MRNAVKGTIYVYTPPCTPHITPSTLRDMATISKMGHTIIMGLPTLRVRRQNPPDGSRLPRASIARDEATQGVSTSWHIWSPIEGTQCPQASYLSLDREVSFTPHLWDGSEPPGFSTPITQERSMTPPGPDLIGDISPCLILWRGTYPRWLSPMNGDPGSTQILTQHFGAQSQTAGQLTNSWTMPTSKSPLFRRSELTKHLRTGFVHLSHHILATRTEPWGSIKLST
jgi:hypothetical protein